MPDGQITDYAILQDGIEPSRNPSSWPAAIWELRELRGERTLINGTTRINKIGRMPGVRDFKRAVQTGSWAAVCTCASWI
jgi:hypothetical protein